MKQLTFLMVMIVVISIPLEISAAIYTTPTLNFNGTTATCNATVTADDFSQYIEVTMKLMNGTTTMASWSADGYGYVYLNKTASVVNGRTYKLMVEITMDGVEKDPVYITGTCE